MEFANFIQRNDEFTEFYKTLADNCTKCLQNLTEFRRVVASMSNIILNRISCKLYERERERERDLLRMSREGELIDAAGRNPCGGLI